MFSRFFIDRPIFASVISIVIVIAGLVTMRTLPIAQYPEISPPTVQVTANYPGANAEVVAETVAQPIEEQVNGVENMLYMSSTSSNTGSYTLTVTFEVGTDLDMAAVLVQNRVAIAEPTLPEEVKRLGVSTKKQSTNILLIASLFAPEEEYDTLYLSNYATLRIKDELARINGVGDVRIFGARDYSMRIWLDADRLKARQLTTSDVVAALREQNVQVAAGMVGQDPAPSGQSFQYTVTTLGRLKNVQQFGEIIVKNAEDGRLTRVNDVARIELGAKNYGERTQYKGKPSVAIGIYQLPGANALDVADQVQAKLANLSKDFPEGMAYHVPFNTTTFVDTAIEEVVQTLLIAVLLVFVTIFVFLQDWRATLIPAITIPVSLIGTFAVMAALGIGINLISLFGIVLAIGIVVDDAIVVVENTVRNINELGLSAREATIQAMDEVTGPVIATTLVMLAVFVPTAFLGGITGQLYRQFALTISAATVFSSINALTLSPALCALVLRPTQVSNKGFFRLFNNSFDYTRNIYARLLSGLIRRAALTLVLFLILAGGAFWGFSRLPTGFVPAEDQGYAFVSIQLPDAASVERTAEVVEEINRRFARMDGVRDWVSIIGFSLIDMAPSSNMATVWVVFDPWQERNAPHLKQDALVGRMWKEFADIQEARIFAFVPPAIRGLGFAGGFLMELQDRGGVGLDTLQQVAGGVIQSANSQSQLQRVYSTFRANVPQLYADVDRTQAKTLDIPLNNVFDTLQAYLGSVYVNDFNKFGRTYQVKVQADAPFRSSAEDIRRLELRNNRGQMIPLGSVVDIDEAVGPQLVKRYNMYPSATINGRAGPGHSSGEALALMEQLADSNLPASFGYEWTGMSYQEKITSSQTLLIFLLAVTFVYLVLCAQYESWSSPLMVILSVPLALLGTVGAVMVRGMDVNVYTQIGIVLLIALASKTSILIVEFAKSKREEGEEIVEASLGAAALRFRPVLMTAFTFILGVAPLVIASGAGSASRQALGTAVFGGMIAATLLLLIFVPVFYVVIQRASEKIRSRWKG
ncbi:RND transporter [Syntrophotalea acetylenivorans]|uniref:RND transporter n=1 Tax=Syntrophotalea acetylenivorans TaxID=1842532 RepID=A0A1L3GRA3_9BACT|nr:multidrug efflux RND transporter permease subunit [Syntrophotalea acetylenivorans]APG28464.1 RND transporter [Syntrophotalea acetylenivorans]